MRGKGILAKQLLLIDHDGSLLAVANDDDLAVLGFGRFKIRLDRFPLKSCNHVFQPFLSQPCQNYVTMNIQRSLSHKMSLRNGKQVSRRDRYRADLKISEKDRQDHLSINWRPEQSPSQLVSKNGSEYTVTDFRWGFEEKGPADDWKPDNQNAVIQADKVKNVYLAVEPFAPEVIAGHGLLVFEMEEDGAVRGPNGQQDFGFAVSVEARRPVGTEYGLIDGMKKKFGMVYELGSLSDQLQKVTRQRGHKLVLHRLELDQEQKKELAHNALDSAVEDRLGEWYHTLTNSCYTACVDLVNEVVPDSQKMARWSKHLKFSRLATSLPPMAGATLRSKDLLAKEPITVLNPDPTLWPDNQLEIGGVKRVIGQASRSGLFKTGFALAGAGAGGALGHAIGGLFGEVGALAGAAVGALSGLGTGAYTADFVAANTDRNPVNALGWYAERGGVSAEEAARRVSHQAG